MFRRSFHPIRLLPLPPTRGTVCAWRPCGSTYSFWRSPARPRPERRRDRRRHSIDRRRRSGCVRRTDGRAAQRVHRRPLSSTLVVTAAHCGLLLDGTAPAGSRSPSSRAEHRRRNGAQRRCLCPASGFRWGGSGLPHFADADLAVILVMGQPSRVPTRRLPRWARRSRRTRAARHLRLRRLRADRRRARSGLLRHAPSRVGQVARRQELGPGVPPPTGRPASATPADKCCATASCSA